MSAPARNTTGAFQHVRLADVDPDFLHFVEEDERLKAREVMVPAIELADGPFDPVALPPRPAESYAIVLSGMVNRQVRIGDQVALRVLGPGAFIPLFDASSSELLERSEWNCAGKVRLAVLGEQFSRACARWPQLQRNLFARFAEQQEQLVAQFALCQLSRVEDRLLAMLWLLAESWGKVTSAGTVLPLQFTHEALGAMVGARRPTVTLALGELAESGAIVQRDGGWLLLQPPPRASREDVHIESPRLIELEPTAWAATVRPPVDPVRQMGEDLFERVHALREETQRALIELQERRRERRDQLADIMRLGEQRERALRELQDRFARSAEIGKRAYEIRDRVREQQQGMDGSSPAGSHR